jgi:hypothetical protein
MNKPPKKKHRLRNLLAKLKTHPHLTFKKVAKDKAEKIPVRIKKLPIPLKPSASAPIVAPVQTGPITTKITATSSPPRTSVVPLPIAELYVPNRDHIKNPVMHIATLYLICALVVVFLPLLGNLIVGWFF